MANIYNDVLRVWTAKAADALKNKILVKQFGATTDTFEVGAKDPSGNMMYLPSDKTPVANFLDLSIDEWDDFKILYGDGDQSTTFVYGSDKMGLGTSAPLNDVATAAGDFSGKGIHIKNTTNPSYLILEAEGNAGNGTEPGANAGRFVFSGNNSSPADNKLMQIGGGGDSIRFAGLNDDGSVAEDDLLVVKRDSLQVGTVLSFVGDNGKMGWIKTVANSISLEVGGSSSALSDLQTAHDGNFYHIDEVAGVPGIRLIVDFITVKSFHWVQLIAAYDGGHAVAVQLYNWSQTRWDTFNSMQNHLLNVITATGYILDNLDFFVPDSSDYVGTGGDDGDVRVRLYHTSSGNASDDLEIDVVALYR